MRVRDMSEDGRSVAGIDPDEIQRCRVHGLLFDQSITDTCPLCEYERTDRVAKSRHNGYRSG